MCSTYHNIFCLHHNSDTVLMCAKFCCDRPNISSKQKHFKMILNFIFNWNIISGAGAWYVTLNFAVNKASMFGSYLKLSKDCNCDECKFENVWIQLTKTETTIIIRGIYRHPKGNITHFNGSLANSLENIKETEMCILVGDMNIDLINLDNQKTYDYLTSLLSQNFSPGITLPTRIKDDSMTLIDHIFVGLPHKRSDRKLLSENKLAYARYKNKVTDCLRIADMKYYEKLLSDRANSANIMWKHLGSMLNPHKHKKIFRIPYLIKEGISISNDHEIANTMNRHFCNIGSELASRQPSEIDGFKKFLSSKIDETIFLSPSSEQEISKEISKLKPNKSSGPDGISPRLIRDCAPCIIKPLTIILNNSLETAKYPSALKMAKVLALYKKNEMYLPNNYRPLSLLSCFDKILEKIIYRRLISFIEKHKILYINQYGFRKKHSTILASINLTDKIKNTIDNGNYAVGIYIDLKKAFDTVDHYILLRKLEHYGIRGKANDLIQNYLSDRYQYTTVNNCSSSLNRIKTGVPQGSVLGPLLFLLYINDVAANVSEDLTLFADDTSVFILHKDLKELMSSAKNCLERLNEWFIENKLSLSIERSNYVIYHTSRRKISNAFNNIIIQNSTIKRVTKVEYLGLVIDEHMNWRPHVNKVCAKLAKYFSVFYNIRK